MQQSLVDRLARVAFVASLIMAAFLYGVAAHGFGWFPATFVEKAWRQARVIMTSETPHWVSERIYADSGVEVISRKHYAGGLTLISGVWKNFGWKPGLKLVDREGRILHQWKADPRDLFERAAFGRPEQRTISGSYLFDNGHILVNIAYTGTVRINACGKSVWTVAPGSHHSIERDDDGNFWVPASSAKPLPSGIDGIEQKVYHDRITKITENGEIIRSLDILEILLENDLLRYIILTGQHDATDITHLNDVEPLPDSLDEQYPLFDEGDLLVSLRELNLVFVLDPTTATVKWHNTLGRFIRQHDPDWMGQGWIGVFDNNWDNTDRGSLLGGSRVVALQPGSSRIDTVYIPEQAGIFYTATQGNWQQLKNGNLLLTESRSGRVVEVTSQGRPVWEWIAQPYNDSLVSEVYRSKRYYLSKEQVSSWPCSDAQTRSSSGGR